MIRSLFRPSVFGVALLLARVPMLAHHSFMSEFDLNKPVLLEGVITKVDWVNPHAAFYIDVTNSNGEVTSWIVQSASPTALVRRGWTRNSLQAGDKVTIEGFRAKNGSFYAAGRAVTLADGRRVLAHSDGIAP